MKNVVFVYFENEISCYQFPTREKAMRFFTDEFNSYKEDIEESDDTASGLLNQQDGIAQIEGGNGSFCVLKLRDNIEGNGIAVFNEEQMDFSIRDRMTEEEMDAAYNEEICDYEGSDAGDNFVGTDEYGYEVGVIKIY